MSTRVRDYVQQVRSKNAGPFWVTIDIFCGTEEAYERVSRLLSTAQVVDAMQQPEQIIKRFDIPALHVVKFSIPRPVVQGHHSDRDMHGAQWAVLVAELNLQN